MYAALPLQFGLGGGPVWQQAGQQYAYPYPMMPYPLMTPQPQWYNPSAVENFASLPPKAELENGDCTSGQGRDQVRISRRYSIF